LSKNFQPGISGWDFGETLSVCKDNTQQKQKDCFNPSRDASVAASLPNNVNTNRSITLLVHYRPPLQFQTCRRVNN